MGGSMVSQKGSIYIPPLFTWLAYLLHRVLENKWQAFGTSLVISHIHDGSSLDVDCNADAWQVNDCGCDKELAHFFQWMSKEKWPRQHVNKLIMYAWRLENPWRGRNEDFFIEHDRLGTLLKHIFPRQSMLSWRETCEGERQVKWIWPPEDYPMLLFPLCVLHSPFFRLFLAFHPFLAIPSTFHFTALTCSPCCWIHSHLHAIVIWFDRWSIGHFLPCICFVVPLSPLLYLVALSSPLSLNCTATCSFSRDTGFGIWPGILIGALPSLIFHSLFSFVVPVRLSYSVSPLSRDLRLL